MKPDGTSSFSAADENPVSPEGTQVTEQDVRARSEVRSVVAQAKPHGHISFCITER